MSLKRISPRSRTKNWRAVPVPKMRSEGPDCALAILWTYGQQMTRASEISPNSRLVVAVIVAAIAGALVVGLVTALHERRKVSATFVGAGSRAAGDPTGIW